MGANVKKLLKSIVIALSLGLTACLRAPSMDLPSSIEGIAIPVPKLDWQSRQAQLEDIIDWRLNAAMTAIQGQQATSASVDWQQHANQYQLTFWGPLGIGSTKLSGNAQKVTLYTADGHTLVATDAESLLKQALGWQLPVNNLYYWVRGLPAPGVSMVIQLDREQRLVSLQQQGWTINYLDYMSINHTDLPSKIFMQNHNLQLRLAISKWQLNS